MADAADAEAKIASSSDRSAAPRERFMYVVATAGDGDEYGVEGSSPDILAVVDTDPASGRFGQILHVTHMPRVGDNLHHFGYSHDKRRLLVPGLYSNRIYTIDLKRDPRRPTIKHVYETLGEDSGYDMPHTVLGLEDGSYLVSMMGRHPGGLEPGGLVILNANGRFQRPFGPAADAEDRHRVHPQYSYDFAPRPDINVMMSSSHNTAAALRDVWNHLDQAPDDIYVWDYAAERVTQIVDLGGDGRHNVGPTEIRWLHDEALRMGFVHGINGALWLFQDQGEARGDVKDGLRHDGTFAFHHLRNDGGALIDIVVSPDDRWLYAADGLRSMVLRYDISDPWSPQLVASVPIPHAGMMRLSADGERLYVTNGIVSSFDDGPDDRRLSPFNKAYGIYLVDVGIDGDGDGDADGPMRLSTDFFVDFSNVPLKNGPGPAGPHMVLFDPDADLGHH